MPFFREVPYLSRPACPPAFDLTPDAWIPLDQGERFRATFPKPPVLSHRNCRSRWNFSNKRSCWKRRAAKKWTKKRDVLTHQLRWSSERLGEFAAAGWMDLFFLNVFRFVLWAVFFLQWISSSWSIHAQYLLWMSTVAPEHLWHPEHPGRKWIYINLLYRSWDLCSKHKSLKPSVAGNQISSLTGGSLFPSYMYARILQVSLKVEQDWTNNDAWNTKHLTFQNAHLFSTDRFSAWTSRNPFFHPLRPKKRFLRFDTLQSLFSHFQVRTSFGTQTISRDIRGRSEI